MLLCYIKTSFSISTFWNMQSRPSIHLLQLIYCVSGPSSELLRALADWSLGLKRTSKLEMIIFHLKFYLILNEGKYRINNLPTFCVTVFWDRIWNLYKTLDQSRFFIWNLKSRKRWVSNVRLEIVSLWLLVYFSVINERISNLIFREFRQIADDL